MSLAQCTNDHPAILLVSSCNYMCPAAIKVFLNLILLHDLVGITWTEVLRSHCELCEMHLVKYVY
jgi:hypothetical protein